MKFPFKKIITHDGKFHADDVMAVAIIKILCQDNLFEPEVIRCKPTQEMLDDKDIIVLDCGLKYEPDNNNYDHHQVGFIETRMDGKSVGVAYATAGLIWKHFGMYIIKNQIAWELVENQLISDIDARDVGKNVVFCQASFSRCIAYFNPTSDKNSSVDFNGQFDKALSFATDVLQNYMRHALDEAKSIDIVLNSQIIDGNIIVLEKYVPWMTAVTEHPQYENLLYIVFPSARGGYNVQQIPNQPGSMLGKKPLPRSWWGLNDEKLVDEIGSNIINGKCFCHLNGFIGGCQDFDGIIEMAKIAVKAKDKEA